jgi:hypothetical protein
MKCIIHNGVNASFSDKLFKEIEELLPLTPSSILFHQPDFMKFNKILLSSKKTL